VYVWSLVAAHRCIIAIVRCQSHFRVSVMKSSPVLLPVFALQWHSRNLIVLVWSKSAHALPRDIYGEHVSCALDPRARFRIVRIGCIRVNGTSESRFAALSAGNDLSDEFPSHGRGEIITFSFGRIPLQRTIGRHRRAGAIYERNEVVR